MNRSFFVTSRHRPRSQAHEPTSELQHPNAVHTSAVRNFLKNMASPSEYATHSSLSQASFYRECECHIQ